MPEVLIALGSNVGDRLDHLQAALDELARSVVLMRVADIYETAPMYIEDQANFLNSAVLVETERSPGDLLRKCKDAEAEVGRRRGRRYGPRKIDIDLIAYGSIRYRFRAEGQAVLDIPHPRLGERRFVLQPLFDLRPDGSLPGLGPIRDLLARTNDQCASVHKVEDAVLSIHRD